MRRRDQVDAELDFHIEMRERELMARGVPAQEARRQAIERLGDTAHLKARLTALGESGDRRKRWYDYLNELLFDARFAVRQMTTAKAFTAIAIGTLAIGIGGTTAIFSAVQAVVLRPFPWVHPTRTMIVFERWHDLDGSVSVGNYTDWQTLTSSFDMLAAERLGNFTLGATPPERVTGGRVTHDFFSVFGQPPLLGRTFRADEDAPGSDHVVVLSEGLWRTRFGADSGILGRVITLNAEPSTVIGVMPAAFDPSLSAEQLWVPIAFTPAERAMHDDHYLLVFGLLSAHASLATAQRDIQQAAATLAARYPKDNVNRSATAYPLGPYLIGAARGQLLFVLGAVTFVFLIACVNVANLLLARASVRARELAIRAATGAGRRRLVRQLLTENALFSLVASALGVALAAVLIRILVAAAPPGAIPRLEQTHINVTVLGFALAVAAIATFASGLLPAVRLASQDPHEILRGEGRGIGAGRARERLRSALVTVEVTMALMLLVGSGLLVKSAVLMQKTPVGFDTSNVSSASVLLPSATYRDPAAIRHAFDQIAATLSASGAIEQSALVSRRPLSGPGSDNGVIPEGRPMVLQSAIQSNIRIITPGYFAAMRIPVRRGRAFTAADVRGANRVMIVSERFAQLAWPGADPIGKRVTCCEGSEADPMWKTIVGVAGDVRSRGPAGQVDPEFYLPVDQAPDDAWRWVGQSMTMVVRSHNSADAITAMRSAVGALDSSLPLFDVESANDAFRAVLAPARFNALLLGTLAFIGLALSAAGIFGVIAYFVALRTHEIGVRRALGASATDVLWLLLRQGVQPVLLGLTCGTVASLFAAQLLRSALYNVGPGDAPTFITVALALAVVALAAILIPARRAMRIEPTRALQF
jgi:putative ABC transport system permease protein